jgi:bacteriocin-like protein
MEEVLRELTETELASVAGGTGDFFFNNQDSNQGIQVGVQINNQDSNQGIQIGANF